VSVFSGGEFEGIPYWLAQRVCVCVCLCLAEESSREFLIG
jgi:hypothetical protein